MKRLPCTGDFAPGSSKLDNQTGVTPVNSPVIEMSDNELKAFNRLSTAKDEHEFAARLLIYAPILPQQ